MTALKEKHFDKNHCILPEFRPPAITSGHYNLNGLHGCSCQECGAVWLSVGDCGDGNGVENACCPECGWFYQMCCELLVNMKDQEYLHEHSVGCFDWRPNDDTVPEPERLPQNIEEYRCPRLYDYPQDE